MDMAAVPIISSGVINDLSGIRHGFFTREGGVSAGMYDSLNCGPGSDDSPQNILANRALVMARLGLPTDALITPYQTHSNVTARVKAPLLAEERPRADALVTTERKIALGILTADCAPVLLADDKAKVIGIAHAGWKGALGGILASVIETMIEAGASRENISAAIGPCITQRSYEVGPEFPAPFLAQSEEHQGLFTPAARPGHFMFDLSAYVFRALTAQGLKNVLRLPHDTFAEEDRFFSYRRSSLRGQSNCGRNLSVIFLE